MKIVVACDSFKGCLSSRDIAATVAEAVRELIPSCEVVEIPVADGGEGTVDALVAGYPKPVRWVTCEVEAPLPELPPVQARYAIDDDTATALMELAQASGLPLVPPGQRDIMRASTFGTGLMMLDAVERGCRHLVMGLGGSATCDGATGALAALGVEFFDAAGRHLAPGASQLGLIHDIDCSGLHPALADTHVTLVIDVDNPLCGPRGAAHVFAPQKGATPHQVNLIETGMQHYAAFLGDVARHPGAGAAGGVGAGLTALLPSCEMVAGAGFIMKHLRLEQQLADADLVITGEGRIDRQTAMGKTPQAVAQLARHQRVPVTAICGSMTPDADAQALGFTHVFAITPPDMPLTEAMRPDVARNNIRNTVINRILPATCNQ